MLIRNNLLRIFSSNYLTQNRQLATATEAAKALASLSKKTLAVEKDATKLLENCCGLNIEAKLSPNQTLLGDKECPEWLWQMDVSQKPVYLSQLPFDSDEYWKKLKKIVKTRQAKLAACRRYPILHPEDEKCRTSHLQSSEIYFNKNAA
ncbi:MAG: Mitochondrial ribosomal protein L54, partial [Marteilia pararefringens]